MRRTGTTSEEAIESLNELMDGRATELGEQLGDKIESANEAYHNRVGRTIPLPAAE